MTRSSESPDSASQRNEERSPEMIEYAPTTSLEWWADCYPQHRNAASDDEKA